jgi:hypothetical protein
MLYARDANGSTRIHFHTQTFNFIRDMSKLLVYNTFKSELPYYCSPSPLDNCELRRQRTTVLRCSNDGTSGICLVWIGREMSKFCAILRKSRRRRVLSNHNRVAKQSLTAM